MTNQEGQKKRLYSDLLKDKVVLVNVFYSTCDSECSIIMDRLTQIQKGLGDKLGREVNILTLSTDPTLDNSKRLKHVSNDLNAERGWEFLTSNQETMAFALSRFGLAVDDKTQHSNMFIIGNVATGNWQMASGFTTINSILQTVEHVMQEDHPNVQFMSSLRFDGLITLIH